MSEIEMIVLQNEVSGYMSRISKLFKPGVKLTVLARAPENDNADFCMTDDSLLEVAKLIERRIESEKEDK